MKFSIRPFLLGVLFASVAGCGGGGSGDGGVVNNAVSPSATDPTSSPAQSSASATDATTASTALSAATVDLGTAPLENGHDEVISPQSTFYYKISVKPGSVYKASLNKVLDGANLEVFTRDGWDSYYLACSDYTYEQTKPATRCVFDSPDSGVVYIRIRSTTKYPENVNLRIDEIVNQGSLDAPVDLGAAPSAPLSGSVLENGKSVYRVAVTPGKYYRVGLTDWTDRGATSSRLYLEVYDGGNTASGSELCMDFGGNAGTDREHRLPIVHCLAKPTSSYLTIVTYELSYGRGATYNIAVEEALTEGAPGMPLDILGDNVVYHGEITATPQNNNDGYSYYQLSVAPNTNYLVDLRGMHQTLDLSIYPDNGFGGTYPVCVSSRTDLIDRSCVVSSDAAGKIYARVETWQDVTDRFILSAMPVPVGAVAPARYPDEGAPDAPIQIGQGLPVSNRPSTVGAGNSYYSVAVSPGTRVRVSATGMNADIDIHVYADAALSNRLCASRNSDAADDSCTFTVPDGVSKIYIRVDGQFTTNNGDWAFKSEQNVGAMFRLSAEQI